MAAVSLKKRVRSGVWFVYFYNDSPTPQTTTFSLSAAVRQRGSSHLLYIALSDNSTPSLRYGIIRLSPNCTEPQGVMSILYRACLVFLIVFVVG